MAAPGVWGRFCTLELDRQPVTELTLPAQAAGTTEARTEVQLRYARGEGAVLEGDGAPFRDVLVRVASGAEVRAWLQRGERRYAKLQLGELALVAGVPCTADASGFDRHTFLCGQSGSGKTYSLGVVLERLLIETDLRMVVLDPNSDFVRLGQVRAGADPALAERYRTAARGVAVYSAGAGAGRRLRLHAAEIDPAMQAALLRLSPVDDREEYAELAELLASPNPPALGTLIAGKSHPSPRCSASAPESARRAVPMCPRRGLPFADVRHPAGAGWRCGWANMTIDPLQELPRAKRRRLIFRGALRGLLTTTVLVILYYELPYQSFNGHTVLLFLVGLLIFTSITAWQVKTIAGSRYPALQGGPDPGPGFSSLPAGVRLDLLRDGTSGRGGLQPAADQDRRPLLHRDRVLHRGLRRHHPEIRSRPDRGHRPDARRPRRAGRWRAGTAGCRTPRSAAKNRRRR